MKILVYGAGVIGGQLCHALCACGQDVSVIARNAWAETLRTEGLRMAVAEIAIQKAFPGFSVRLANIQKSM